MRNYKILLLEISDKKCFTISIPELVKYPRWQKVRRELKGIWSKDAKKGLSILKSFLGPVNKASCIDLRAVLNYLAALRGIVSNKNPEVVSYRGRVKAEVDKRRKALV